MLDLIRALQGECPRLRNTDIYDRCGAYCLRVRPESFDGISMTCSVVGDRYSWYAANKATQFQWQHPWWYPQVIEMTPDVPGQTLSLSELFAGGTAGAQHAEGRYHR
jgi:hypothetical protein